MKVLFVINELENLNPFAATLCEGLRNCGVDVVCSSSEFLTNAEDYDIIHFQWPESIFSWKRSISDEKLNLFRTKVEEIKRHNVKISITCHNLKPHLIKDKNILLLYDIIYENCDLFLHMGEYSLELLKNKYPNGEHRILPHHLYDSIYKFDKKKNDCRKILDIPTDKFCILCFGNFRTEDERKLVINARDTLKDENFEFLTPSFYRKKIICKRFWELFSRLYYTILYKSRGMKFKKGIISSQETELYFCAADIVLLQRVKILNSGNLPMGFAAGKVVVGPEIGNVGTILKQTGNPVFNPKDNESVVDAIREAKRLVLNGKGRENKHLAESFWKTSVVAEQLKKYYEELISIE